MCVTLSKAHIGATQAATYATTLGGRPRHVTLYKNSATNGNPDPFVRAQQRPKPNCMFLNFRGTDIQLVRGPERTKRLMQDITADLPYAVPMREFLGSKGVLSYGALRGGPRVEEFGDYTVILSDGPGDILGKLEEVRPDRRPERTPRLEEWVNFFLSYTPEDGFGLACFDGSVQPDHPLAVSYDPHDPSQIAIPGLDGHEGIIPDIGGRVTRDFSVAVGIEGANLAHEVHYSDRFPFIPEWAPQSVAGFIDNREDVDLNGDYVWPIEAVLDGLDGGALADAQISPLELLKQ